MPKRALLVVPALAGLAFLTTRLTPGPLKDGTTLLPSGWRIHPAGRQIAVGTLPLNLATLSDRSLVVTNNGYGENGLMRVDPVAGRVVWHHPLRAAWLGLARSGREWRDTVWASGGGTNRVYRLIWLGGAGWTSDSATLAATGARLFAAGRALVPSRGLVAVVGNLSDSVYLIDAATLTRRGAVAVGHTPYTVVADSSHLYVSDWGDSTVSVIDLSVTPPVRRSTLVVGPHPSALALRGSALFVALAGANGNGNGPGRNADGKYIANAIAGSISIVPVPDAAPLARYTREAYALSPYSNTRLRGLTPDRLAAKPPVRHVVYIIRENRTYDQVLGDIPAGNGDPSLTIFNDSVTPTAHAIARRWVLLDNFYVNGEISAVGHEWSDRAFASDYNEKTWPHIYSDRRKWDLTSGADLANPPDAYLWDAAKRKGLWVVNFGEMTE